jgi:hypothetical protein
MNFNHENPDILGGLGDLLPAEVLKKVYDLLELLKNEKMKELKNENEKGIEINIYEKGSQHVETQVNIGNPPPPKREGSLKRERNLPDILATEEAMALWEKVQRAGYVDENFQPLISRTQAALLADAMAGRLGIREKWKVFEALWNRKYMRSDYNLALTQQQSLEFQDELKQTFG